MILLQSLNFENALANTSITFILLLGLLYFLPALISLLNGKSNTMAIFALNLFLGWTFIGWIVALVWALTNDTKPQSIIVNATSTSEKISNNQNIHPTQPPSKIEHTALLSETSESEQDIKQNYSIQDEKIKRLKQLKELLNDNILTQEEFDIEKSKLLKS